ncbi:MAG: hypothetical protein IPG43_08405 [Proteobacteria bacterium]|nr:hypothetical protein [Pseudomonadota bacterium]
MAASASQARRAVLLALGLLGASRAWADVTSIADWPCAEWQQRRASGERVDAPQMWLSGYMTGLAIARDTDVLAFTHPGKLFEAMDKFCIAHPEQHISAGGIAIFDQILHSLPTTPPRAL